MALFSTMAIVGAAVAGTAATVLGVRQQKKAAKAQRRAIKKQETEARERASLDSIRNETGAEIKLGRGTASQAASDGSSDQGAATTRTGSVAGRVGGLGAKGRVSKRVGL